MSKNDGYEPPDDDRPEPCRKCKGYHMDEVEECPKTPEDEIDDMKETHDSLNRWLDSGILKDIKRNGWGGY